MRYCDSCKLDVKIGFSRESNWTTHTESVAHCQNEASKGTPGKSKLTSFFQKKLPGSSPRSLPSAASPSLLCNPMHSFSGLSLAGPSSVPHVVNTPNDELIVVDSDGSPPPPPTIPPGTGAVSTTSLLSKLKCVSISLPLSTPKGTEIDALARFSGNPILELEVGQDAWEMADRTLNGIQ